MPGIPHRSPSEERTLRERYPRTGFLLGLLDRPPWETTEEFQAGQEAIMRRIRERTTPSPPPAAARMPQQPLPANPGPVRQPLPPPPAPAIPALQPPQHYAPPPYPPPAHGLHAPPVYHHLPPALPFPLLPPPHAPGHQFVYYPQPPYAHQHGFAPQPVHPATPQGQNLPVPIYRARGPVRRNPIQDGQTIDVSIPRNTGVVSGVVSRSTLRLPTDLPFADFFSRICAQMDLDPLTAQLGYKYHTDKVRDPAHRLSNDEEFRQAMDYGIDLMQRARSRRIFMEVHNLVPAPRAPPPHQRRRGHGAPQSLPQNDSEHTVSFRDQLHKLKDHLQCQKHTGRWCFIDPITGEHIYIDLWQITLWAKKWLLGEASLRDPPESLRLNDRPQKRSRRVTTSSSSSMPAIHVHMPDIYSRPVPSASSSSSTPAPRASSSRVILEDQSPPPSTLYPPIGRLLNDLHDTMPIFNLPSLESIFVEAGLDYVDSITYAAPDFLVEALGVPSDAVDLILEHAHALKIRAEKGEGKAEVIELD